MNIQAAPKFDQARKYLERVLPWPSAAEVGCIHLCWTRATLAAKPTWHNHSVRSLDEALEVLEEIIADLHTRDVYVCQSLQHDSKRRSSYGAIALKSLFLDIDFKNYNTPAEAVVALNGFIKAVNLAKPSAVVASGGGLHVYFALTRALPAAEWQPLARALAEATKRHGLKCDTQCTVDAARVLRIPDTWNRKLEQPRPVGFAGPSTNLNYDVERLAQVLEPYKVATAQAAKPFLDPKVFPVRPPLPGESDLSAGIERSKAAPIDIDAIASECAFVSEALTTGGADYTNPLWNLTTFLATFCQDGRAQAHRMGNEHPGYTIESTDQLFDRKERERHEKNLGWPSCQTISGYGYKLCQACPHLKEGKSPLNLAARPLTSQVTSPAMPTESVSFADPYADFVGPVFPTSILPPVLTDLVEAQHRSMGADPSAIAMAGLTALAGAINGETKIQVGDGWVERPIIWTALIGQPSAMKSPIIDKVTKPLRKIDSDRDAVWRGTKLAWEQAKASGAKPGPCPPKPARCVLQDATAEKTAEILSRGTAGTLMVQDELAGWFGSFERYNSGPPARGLYLTSWNGGSFLKDRVGQGVRDEHAEIRVDNLALGILGGIQPERLAALRDLTSDGLLQRFLPVLMRAAERGDESHPVYTTEVEYGKLIESVQAAPPRTLGFGSDAEEVRKRVLDQLFELEQVDGFSSAVIGAIGKLKAYFARVALTLHVAGEHSVLVRGGGMFAGQSISRQTAEATEKLVFDFLLPHMFGLYDVVVNGGQDRDTVRAIADFILASTKDRLRPSDFGSGVRRLRNEPTNKIAEWASRFITMGWLRPEDEKLTTPKAWFVQPGLRTHFAARRQAAQAARAAAHAILKAGGSRR
jgi:hypothetical protein